MGRLLATALAFLTIAAGPAPPASTPLTAGGEYEGRIVVCIAKAEAEHLLDLVSKGQIPAASDYLSAKDNTCGVDDGAFKAVEQIGPTVPDAAGRPWKLVRITTEAGDLFMLTTSVFEAKPGKKT